MPVSAQLFDRAASVIPGGVNSPVRAFKSVGGTPRFIASAKGCTLIDVDGNEYVDLVNGFGQTMFGHSHNFVTAALAAQLQDGFPIGPQTPLAGSEWLVWWPDDAVRLGWLHRLGNLLLLSRRRTAAVDR